MIFWHWILHVTGIDNPAGRWGTFWSGFGADLGEFLILGGIVSWYRARNCKTRGCWRFGHHDFTDPKDGVSRKLCWKHHPDVRHSHLTAKLISEIHERRIAEREASGQADI